MITPQYCLIMAQYGRWMNARLYAVAAGLDDQTRQRDMGAFFGSVQGTLNHLLWGDLIWFGRFIGESLVTGGPKSTLEGDFGALRLRREALDARILVWAEDVSAEWLDSRLRWTSKVDGKTRDLPFAVCVMQLFNHGTHHRGQLTTLYSQLGIDPGETDLPWLPELHAVQD